MPQPAVLTSWKQIAACLGCGVRTAQRWEECLALPVHRPKGKDRYVVLAFTDELEAWLRRTPVRQKENAGNIEIAGIAPALHPLLEELNVVLEQVADLVGRQLYEEAGAAIDCGRRIVRELISAISQRASA